MGNTLIKVNCIDQRLIVANPPLIAAGGCNEDRMEFEFCSLWEGFEKTAVFYRDSEKAVYHIPLESDACLIPHEVIADEGWMYFGVFGVSDDVRRTTAIAKYKIERGAITGYGLPSDPTSDIYAQYLEQILRAETAADNAEKMIEELTIFGDEAIAAEAERVKAEKQRAETFAGFKSEINQLSEEMGEQKSFSDTVKADFYNGKLVNVEPAETVEGVYWYKYSDTKAYYAQVAKYGYKRYNVADLSAEIVITTYTGDTAQLYFFVTSDNTIILAGINDAHRCGDKVSVPKDATTLYVNYFVNAVTDQFGPYGVKAIGKWVKKARLAGEPTTPMVADATYPGYYTYNSTDFVRFEDNPSFTSYSRVVKAGEIIRLKSNYFAALAGYILTDNAMKPYFVKHTSASGASAYDDTISIEQDGYVFYTAYGASEFFQQGEKVDEVKPDVLAGKKIAFDGDSITMASGEGVVGYVQQIADLTGCIVQNFAVDGGTLTSGTVIAATGAPRHHVCESIIKADEVTDIYCISGGYNDWGIGQSAIGEYSEVISADYTQYDTTTLYGAMDYIFTWLMVNRPGKPILFIITHNALNYRISGGANLTANVTLGEWVEHIKKMCKKYSVPYVDLFDTTPLMTKLDTLKQFTVNGDGVHPTTEGYKIYYVPRILTELHAICPID